VTEVGLKLLSVLDAAHALGLASQQHGTCGVLCAERRPWQRRRSVRRPL
jgi:hypothetical protein